MWRTRRSVARFLAQPSAASSGSTTPDSPTAPIMRWRKNIWLDRACSLLTFGVRGGFEAAKNFYDALNLIKRLVNLGDAKSLACHPASTTHRQMSPEEQRKAGVRPETIRLSIGIEHIDDIVADLDQALQAASSQEHSARCRAALSGIRRVTVC